MMRWLLTYADMITLLLALFIILFSISTINKVKLQRLVHDLGGGFNSSDAINNPPAGTSTVVTDDLQKIQAQINQYVKQNNLQSKVMTAIKQDGKRRELVITLLTDKALYDSGKADLKQDTERILDAVNGQLKARSNEIRVEGHTDNVPISNAQFASNWELSAARAAGVLRYLVEHDGLPANRVGLAGYGSERPKVANDTEAHRAANRRVDIVILDTDRTGSPTGSAAAAAAAADAEGL